jgi:hypothetical protein
MDSHFARFVSLFEDFQADIEEEMDLIGPTIDGAFEEVGKAEKWWESINIFSPGTYLHKTQCVRVCLLRFHQKYQMRYYAWYRERKRSLRNRETMQTISVGVCAYSMTTG